MFYVTYDVPWSLCIRLDIYIPLCQFKCITPMHYFVLLFIRPPVYGSNGRSYKMLVMFLFFQRVISELPRPITAKLRHMIGTCVYFINWLQKFGELSPQKIGGQKHAKFRSISYNLRLWSRISPEWLKISKNGKLMFPDRFLLRSKKKVWWTLVH